MNGVDVLEVLCIINKETIDKLNENINFVEKFINFNRQ